MEQPGRALMEGRHLGPAIRWLGPVLSLAVAVGLCSLFSIDDRLSRDESIYLYGGQQLAAGVPPYVSILDPKTPLATMTAGVAVWTGRVVGVDDVVAARLAYFLVSCLAVLAVYLAASHLFESVAAGLVGAVVLIAFHGFAMDALGGPNPKTPALFLAALATALLLHRQWFWGGFVASLASLAWQPLVIYVLVAIGAAWVGSDRIARLRGAGAALAGAAIPATATVAYFTAVGALDELVDRAILLPLTGTVRRDRALGDHVGNIVEVVRVDFGVSALLVVAGMVALVVLSGIRLRQRWGDRPALARDPLVTVVLPPLLFITAFSVVDFQGYDDAYPFLLYAALGVAGAVMAMGSALEHRVPSVARLVPAGVAVVLAAGSFVWYLPPGYEDLELGRQRDDAAAVNELLGSDGTLHVLGDPWLLVLTGRTNPSPYIYLSAGVDQWVVEHIPGGFDGWVREIEAGDPDMVWVNAWITRLPDRARMLRWLERQYESISVGELDLFVTAELRDRALGRQPGELLR